MKRFLDALEHMLWRYTPGQRVLIIVVLIGIISAVISLVMWANRPEYTLLYSELDPAAASKIVSELRSMKVKFQLENNGRTILVPSKEADELRLRFADQGYAGSTVKGYEVFDNAKIGMTTFMQQLNMRRALEGELVKTINQFPGVQNSRVHLVLPDGNLFEDDKKGSASVVLHLKKGMYLSNEQVRGIAAMVSNGVKGIKPDDVVIVDAEGNLLSDPHGEDDDLGSVRNQWDLRTSLETKLQRKVKRIVEGIVGNNNAVVEVVADLNFEQIQRTTEAYDPDKTVVVSEERHSETSDNGTAPVTSEDVITNYELQKTQEHYVSNTGTISKISVAVLVNGKMQTKEDENGDEVAEYIPRNNKELEQIATLVRSAVGYNIERGDVVEVRNLQFDRSSYEEDKNYFIQTEKRELVSAMISKSLLGLGLLAAFLIVKGLLKSTGKQVMAFTAANLNPAAPQLALAGINSQAELASGSNEGVEVNVPKAVEKEPASQDGPKLKRKVKVAGIEEEIDEDLYIMKLSPEARAKLRAKDRMTEDVLQFATNNPEDAAKLLKTWIRAA